jgi:drug/metabolite transporter (DMT)-like permease
MNAGWLMEGSSDGGFSDSMRFYQLFAGGELMDVASGRAATRRVEGKRSMVWMIFVLGAVLSWGVYGVALHKGQVQLGNPMRALLCVGAAYFLIGVLVPVLALSAQGGLTGFNLAGTAWATLGGALGAIGAVCIIYAFRNGGLPNYVMPLVFGGAPVINVLVTMAVHPPKTPPNPMLYLGFALAIAGAGIVLYYKPS